MTDASEWIQRAQGHSPQAIVEFPQAVTIVPDDYEPPLLQHGLTGASVAAGGIGTRSEVLLIVSGQDPTGLTVEIENLWFLIAATTHVEVVARATGDPAALGFTDVPFQSTDIRARGSAFRVQRRVGAATGWTRTIAQELTGALAFPLPTRIILGRGTAANVNGVIVRPDTDQEAIDVIVQWRERARRKI